MLLILAGSIRAYANQIQEFYTGTVTVAFSAGQSFLTEIDNDCARQGSALLLILKSPLRYIDDFLF